MDVGVAYQEALAFQVALDGIAGGLREVDVSVFDGELCTMDDDDVAIERQLARACNGG